MACDKERTCHWVSQGKLYNYYHHYHVMMTKGCVGSDHGWVSQCNHPRRCSATIWRTIAAYHHCSHLSFDAIITFINFVIFLILIDATIYPFR